MEKNRKNKRKTFAARQDLIEHASLLAKEKGYSLYAYINELLQLTIEAENIGVNFRTLLDERGILKSARDASFILGLENLWYDMADISYEKAKRKSLNSWIEAGAWMAKNYISRWTKDPFSAFKRDLKTFTWNATELDITTENDAVTIRIISPRFSEAYTILFAAFLESALKTFGYNQFTKDVIRGTIRLKAVRKRS